MLEFCVVNVGDEATNSIDSDWSMDCSAGAVVRVKTLHISSPILAAKSPFFYKVDEYPCLLGCILNIFSKIKFA